jgi:hypothetical protein
MICRSSERKEENSMRAFAIVETNVTAFPTVAEAKQAVAAAAPSEPRLAITSEAELAASPLSVGQLTEIWNGFAGVAPFDDLKPVRKFTDRKTAVARIWRAIQRLTPASTVATVGEPGAQGAPKRTRSTQEATARPGSKTAMVLELLRRPEGATLQQLVEATRWRPHSVRGFLSGTLAKKVGHKITRAKRDDGASAYFLTE